MATVEESISMIETARLSVMIDSGVKEAKSNLGNTVLPGQHAVAYGALESEAKAALDHYSPNFPKQEAEFVIASVLNPEILDKLKDYKGEKLPNVADLDEKSQQPMAYEMQPPTRYVTAGDKAFEDLAQRLKGNQAEKDIKEEANAIPLSVQKEASRLINVGVEVDSALSVVKPSIRKVLTEEEVAEKAAEEAAKEPSGGRGF